MPLSLVFECGDGLAIFGGRCFRDLLPATSFPFLSWGRYIQGGGEGGGGWSLFLKVYGIGTELHDEHYACIEIENQ